MGILDQMLQGSSSNSVSCLSHICEEEEQEEDDDDNDDYEEGGDGDGDGHERFHVMLMYVIAQGLLGIARLWG